MDQVTFKINNSYQNMTIKEFLKTIHVGRGKIEEIRVNKRAFINSQVESLDYILKKGDILSFIICEKINYDVKNVDETLDVLYEDDYLLIVNKSAGMLVHGDGNDNNITLCHVVAKYYSENNIERNVRPIHRIDVDTSGIVIFAKDFITEAALCYELEQHNIERKYLALVSNSLPAEGTITYRLGRDRHNAKKWRVSSTGVEATTHFKIIKNISRKINLVELKLETGRTHQIRVHMSHRNNPLLGDLLYNGDATQINRTALHSSSVVFINPITKDYITVECPLPSDMRRIIDL